jgi:hypothetical protein
MLRFYYEKNIVVFPLCLCKNASSAEKQKEKKEKEEAENGAHTGVIEEAFPSLIILEKAANLVYS